MSTRAELRRTQRELQRSAKTRRQVHLALCDAMLTLAKRDDPTKQLDDSDYLAAVDELIEQLEARFGKLQAKKS